MIGQTISHFHILEKPPTTSGQVGEGGMSQNGPRTLFVPLFVPFRLCGGTSILVPNEEVRDGTFRSSAGFTERNPPP